MRAIMTQPKQWGGPRVGLLVVLICSTLLLESWGSTKAGPASSPPSLVKHHKHARRLFKRFSNRYGEVTNIDEVQWTKQQDGKVVPVPFHGAEDEEFVPSATGPSLLRIMGRTLYLLWNFAPAIFTALLAFFIPSFRNPYWYRMLTRGISYSGAAFIKWGQWSSTRPDIFPEDLCGVMAMLHSDAPVHSYEHSRREVEGALKVPLEQVFDSFEREPIASGSIAQVHVATIKNHKVAVKVRHPGVAEQIDVDFRIMRAVGNMADQIPALKFLNLGHSMEQFSHTLGSQTRLDVEGVHLLLLNENFRGWSDAGFPAPIFLSEAVLIETFEEGCTLSEYIKKYNSWKDGDVDVYGSHFRQFLQDTVARAYQGAVTQVRSALGMKDRAELQEARGGGDPELMVKDSSQMPALSWDLANFVVRTGEDVYLKMLLADNLMHCDLHPGNILLHSGNKGEPRLVLVDAGMVARLTDEERETFIGILEAMGEGNGRRAAQHVLSFSKTQTCQGEDRENFIREMDEIFKEKCRGYGTGVSIGDVLRDVLRIVRQYQLRVDVNYATLVINLLCIEGIATALDPSYNLLDRAQPLLWPHSQRAIRPMYKKVFPVLLSLKRRGDRIWAKLTSKVANKPRHHQAPRGGSDSDSCSSSSSSSSCDSADPPVLNH